MAGAPALAGVAMRAGTAPDSMIVGTGLGEGEHKIQPQPSAGAASQHGLLRKVAAQQFGLLHGVISPLPSGVSCMAAHAFPGHAQPAASAANTAAGCTIAAIAASNLKYLGTVRPAAAMRPRRGMELAGATGALTLTKSKSEQCSSAELGC